MARITYAPAAVDDLCNIVSFIAQDNPDAAHNWLQRIAEVCELLAENPMIGEERRDFSVLGCRCFTVGNYVVLLTSNIVKIFTMLSSGEGVKLLQGRMLCLQ